jgi:sugar/nucleoside kinase (ribokinase family)/phosphoglycolate phosphatase-like HAD superfamily hydrolase
MIHRPAFTADSPWLDGLLARLPEACIGVFGDLGLDAYWILDDQPGETSLETGLVANEVREQRYSPAAGGNVAANAAALGVRRVELAGLIGGDMMGGELLRQFEQRGLSTRHVVRGPASWHTLVFAKPYRGGAELNRLDFGVRQLLSPELLRALLEQLTGLVQTCPVVVINQQVPGGWPPELVAGVAAILREHPRTHFIVDSRDHADALTPATLKLNLREASRLVGEAAASFRLGEADGVAGELSLRRGRPVAVTRGEHGLALAVEGELFDVPGIELPGPVDAVGAGDTAVAALAAAFAVGAPPLEAGAFANLAAAFTSHQLHTTGAATPADLRAIGPAPDYVFAPRLAADVALAQYLPGASIELTSDRRSPPRIRHAIFDHDGTLSVLRRDWEQIMEPMMIAAILGPHAAGVSAETRARVTSTVRHFIDRTTGIQTLAQMKGLVDLVREFGFVAPAEVKDEHAYKAIFNESLLALVRSRIAQVERGELTADDWQMKGARPFIERLHAAGVTLYLASGTDHEDAVAEARLLGYERFFTGGIFGSVGDLRVEAKRDLLARILQASGARGEEILVVGDGPVEIREGRRRGAFTVGVASDELRRHGLNPRKRTRLIRAGADLVIPDFGVADRLLAHLGLA